MVQAFEASLRIIQEGDPSSAPACLHAHGSMVALFNGIFDGLSATSQPLEAISALCSAFLDVSLLHLATVHLGATSGQLQHHVRQISHFWGDFRRDDPLSLVHIRAYMRKVVMPILHNHREESPQGLPSRERFTTLFLEAWHRVAQLPGACSGRRNDFQLGIAREALELAGWDIGPLSGAGLHVVLAGEHMATLCRTPDFWCEVECRASSLGLSGGCFDLACLDDRGQSWGSKWTSADELGSLYVDTLQFQEESERGLGRVMRLMQTWRESSSSSSSSAIPAWESFKRGASRCAALQALAKLLRSDGVSRPKDLEDLISDCGVEGLRAIHRLLQDTGTQVQVMHRIGIQARNVLLRTLSALEEFGMDSWRSLMEDSNFRQGEMPWLSTKSPDTPERRLCCALLSDESVDGRLQAINAYLHGASAARARFVLATVCLHRARYGDRSFQSFVQGAEVRRRLELQDYQADLLVKLTGMELTHAPCMGAIQRDWQETGSDHQLALGYVLAFLAAAEKDTSFMHFRFFPVAWGSGDVQGIGAITHRGDSYSPRDCGYIVDRHSLPLSDLNAWAGFLTWASLCAGLIRDFDGNFQNVKTYITPSAIDKGNFEQHLYTQGPELQEKELHVWHVRQRWTTFLEILRQNLGDNVSCASLIGHSMWHYVQCCEGQVAAEDRCFLTHRVTTNSVAGYEHFLDQKVLQPGRADTVAAEHSLAVSDATTQHLARQLTEWAESLEQRRRMCPVHAKLKDTLPAETALDDTTLTVAEREGKATAQLLQHLLDADSSRRVAALHLVPKLAHWAKWFVDLCSAHLDDETLAGLPQVADVRRLILQSIHTAREKRMVERGLQELIRVWRAFDEACPLDNVCANGEAGSIPDDLSVPLPYVAATRQMRAKEWDEIPVKMLLSLTKANNDALRILMTTELGRAAGAGRVAVGCELLRFMPHHLTMRSLEDLNITHLLPIFLVAGEDEAGFKLDVRMFAAMAVDRGLRGCVEFPGENEVQDWLTVHPVPDFLMPSLARSASGDEAESEGEDGSRELAVAPRAKRRRWPAEFAYLQHRCRDLRDEILERAKEASLFSVQEELAGSIQSGHLGQVEPRSDILCQVASELSEVINAVLVDSSWISVRQLGDRRLNSFGPRVSLGLGSLSPIQIPSLVAALTSSWLRPSPELTSGPLSQALGGPEKRSVRSKLLAQFRGKPRDQQREAAHELASWLNDLANERRFEQLALVPGVHLADVKAQLPQLPRHRSPALAYGLEEILAQPGLRCCHLMALHRVLAEQVGVLANANPVDTAAPAAVLPGPESDGAEDGAAAEESEPDI